MITVLAAEFYAKNYSLLIQLVTTSARPVTATYYCSTCPAAATPVAVFYVLILKVSKQLLFFYLLLSDASIVC